MKKIFLTFLLAVVLYSCVSETAKQTLNHYNEVYVKVDEIETLLQYTDLETLSVEDLVDLYDIAKELSYSFNPMDLKPEQIAACELLKQRVIKVRSELLDQTSRVISKYRVHAWECADKLMEETQTFPVYMLRGEKLYWNIKAQKPIGVKIYNSDSRQLIKTYTGKTICSDSLAIQNTAIYLVEVSPNGSQYLDMDIYYKSNDVQRLKRITPVKAEDIECGANDFRPRRYLAFLWLSVLKNLENLLSEVNLNQLFREVQRLWLQYKFQKVLLISYIQCVFQQVKATVIQMDSFMIIWEAHIRKSNLWDFLYMKEQKVQVSLVLC